MGEKYIVFKAESFDKLLLDFADKLTPVVGEALNNFVSGEVEDAVVIRRQDIFAPPALDAYANAIQCVIELSKGSSVNGASIKGLQDIADYFHDQAAKSWTEQRKLPD